MGEQFRPKEEEPEKTDWSLEECILKQREEKSREKMTPEQIEERKRGLKQAEDYIKWFDMKNKLENGTSEEKAEAKKFFDDEAKQAEAKQIEEERKRRANRTPEQIAEDIEFEMNRKRISNNPQERIEAEKYFAPREREATEKIVKMNAEVHAMVEKNREILKRRSEAVGKEIARLKEIRKTRLLTKEEKDNIEKLARLGPLPEEKQ